MAKMQYCLCKFAFYVFPRPSAKPEKADTDRGFVLAQVLSQRFRLFYDFMVNGRGVEKVQPAVLAPYGKAKM